MRFLLLGSYERRKGQDVFLDAIAQLPEGTRARGLFPHGRPANLEKEFYEALAARAAELPNVELSGALEHDAALAATNAADVLVCASRDETMPIAILEAMSLGQSHRQHRRRRNFGMAERRRGRAHRSARRQPPRSRRR